MGRAHKTHLNIIPVLNLFAIFFIYFCTVESEYTQTFSILSGKIKNNINIAHIKVIMLFFTSKNESELFELFSRCVQDVHLVH